MDEMTCGSVKCKRYPLVIREFRLLRGEIWDASFSAKLGKAASKLYREIYGKRPNRRRSKRGHRNFVTRFPCGILEQAYRQLREQGVPLTALWRRQMEERQIQRQGSELRDPELNDVQAPDGKSRAPG